MAADTGTGSHPPSPQERFDAFQQGRSWLAFALAVVKKNGDEGGGNLAALIAYYGFFSLFPLLLVFATILGYVLHGHPHQQLSVEHAVTKNFPSLTKFVHFKAISGSIVALIIGVLTSLYSGLGITGASQNAMNMVWAVPRKDRPSWIKQKLRGLTLLVALGVLFVVSSFASGAVSAGFGGAGTKVAGYVVSLIVNFGLFFISFRLMTEDVRSSDLWTGAAFGAVMWTVLESVGAVYLKHATGGTYGALGTVIGLIIWLHLGAQIFLYSAEINAVRARRLWPRTFLGPPSTDADRRALRQLAETERRHEGTQIDVDFADEADEADEQKAPADR